MTFTLFAGADSGSERAAQIYSLLGTAKLNSIDPEASLCHVLMRIAEHPVNRVDDFLPWNCAAQLAVSASRRRGTTDEAILRARKSGTSRRTCS